MKGDIVILFVFLVEHLAAENVLFIQGGVSKLKLDDIFSSEITNVTEIIGCPENVSLPNYPNDVFGSQLHYFDNMLISCGGANFEGTFSACFAIDSRSIFSFVFA